MKDRPRGRPRLNPTRPGQAAHDDQRRRTHPRTVHAVDPRQVAFDTLRRLTPGELIEPAVIATLRHQGAEFALAQRVGPMVEDAARFALLFDHLIAHVATRPVSELDSDVRSALHLFLAWLVHDPKSAYAHGNAAVDLLSTRHAGRGFVNACVRKLSGFVSIQPAEEFDYRGAAARQEQLPLWVDRCRLGMGRMLVAERPLFPDPADALAAHLSIVGGLPQQFVELLIEQHGPAAAVQVATAAIERPATWVRPNTLFAESFHLPQWWTARGVSVETVDRPDGGTCYALPAKAHDVTEHPDFSRGGFYVQDYAAQLVAPMLGAEAGEALLDLCSAPGGKAGHLAELTGDRARILACDVTESKQERIRENIERMGYRSIATVVADAATVRFPEKFDRVLIDAPCSNSGVLARRVEARHRITPASLAELAALQRRILENAAANLKPGGKIVYSVCSVLMEECVDIVHAFMGPRESAGWTVEEERFILPVPGWHDGGYICRLGSP